MVSPQTSKKYRVLIVDDHELMRKCIRQVIARIGLCAFCSEAENGREAIYKCQELKPDLVILDISMPVMGGIEAALHIRKLLPAVKILIVTIHESQKVEEIVKLCGADGLIKKPDLQALLIPSVKQLLNIPAP